MMMIICLRPLSFLSGFFDSKSMSSPGFFYFLDAPKHRKFYDYVKSGEHVSHIVDLGVSHDHVVG